MAAHRTIVTARLSNTKRELDRIDRGIVRALWEDPQMANTRIAERAGISELTVASRLDALIRDQLIKITVQRDIRTVGLTVMGLVEIWIDRRDAFEVGEEIGAFPEVLSVTVALGHPQLIILMMAKGIGEFLEVLERRIAAVAGVSKTVTSISLEVVSFRPGIVKLS